MHLQTLATSAKETQRDPGAVLESSTFSAGIRLLPPTLLVDARRLYCMLRTLDDLVDEQHPDATGRVEAVERWARDGKVSSPETETLAELSRRYPLSARPIIDFCKGMRHDIAGETIVSERDLDRYAYRVAGTVGVMIAELFGTTDDVACKPRMALLGAAMQRTNILRDIDEDHENGRLYIALQTIERFGVPEPGAREALFRDQIARADALYERGWRGLRLLRGRGRQAMTLSTALYREILRQIEREGFGRNAGRVSVPLWRKALLLERYRSTS